MGGPDFSQLVQWLPLIYLGSGALLAVVVMVDCGNTGQDPVFWAIAILIFNLLAFIVYFMVARLEIGPTRKHTAITRHRDDELRDQYASRGDPDELATMGTMAPKLGGIPESHANLNFVDPTLEKLLDEGKIREAKQYFDDLVAVANEMNDKATIRNLKKYELKISKAMMR